MNNKILKTLLLIGILILRLLLIVVGSIIFIYFFKGNSNDVNNLKDTTINNIIDNVDNKNNEDIQLKIDNIYKEIETLENKMNNYNLENDDIEKFKNLYDEIQKKYDEIHELEMRKEEIIYEENLKQQLNDND